MAQDITIADASYLDVPSISVKKTNGGYAKFTDVTDTTAVAADVALGKLFFNAGGVLESGTASGGSGSIVEGTFEAGLTGTGVNSIELPYEGSGYPIMAMVAVDGGMYGDQNAYKWYWELHKAAVGVWACVKHDGSLAPTYSTNSQNNQAAVIYLYKDSDTSRTSFNSTYGYRSHIYSSIEAASSQLTCIRFRNSNTLSVFVSGAKGEYGLLKDIVYRYVIVYKDV